VEDFERSTGWASPLRESPVTRVGAAALAEAMELYGDDFLLGLAVHRALAFKKTPDTLPTHPGVLRGLFCWHPRGSTNNRTAPCLAV